MMQLPVLDDKPYQILLEEAFARIPILTEHWTDFNPSDTGVLLLEACAALTEAQIYWLDHAMMQPCSQYLKLMCPMPDESPLSDRIAAFATQCGSDLRAATPEDYERLARSYMPDLDAVRAKPNGAEILLTVYRKSGALSREELCALREMLEPHRLLTVRLVMDQVVCTLSDINCRVKLKQDVAPENMQKMIETFLRDAVGTFAFDEENVSAQLQLKLLAVPEIADVTGLAIQHNVQSVSLSENDITTQPNYTGRAVGGAFVLRNVQIGFD